MPPFYKIEYPSLHFVINRTVDHSFQSIKKYKKYLYKFLMHFV